MDELLGTILGRLGIRLPGMGGVPEGQQVDPLKQAMLDKAAKEQQAKFPPVQKAMVDGIDAATDFAKGLNYFPTDEVPQDSGAAYKAGALAAALPLGMFSRVDKIAESLPERIHPNKLLTILKNRAAKEEVNWRGLDSFIADKGEQQIPKAEITEHLAQHPLDVNVIKYGDGPEFNEAFYHRYGRYPYPHENSSMTQYREYQMPGARNYKEDLIQLNTPRTGDTVPNDFIGHHWDDPNILVHVRHNERQLPPDPILLDAAERRMTDARLHTQIPPTNQEQDAVISAQDARDALSPMGRMIENIQSDWHQRGAHGGYTRSDTPNVDRMRMDEAEVKASLALDKKNKEIIDYLNGPNSKYPAFHLQDATNTAVEDMAAELGQHLNVAQRDFPELVHLYVNHSKDRVALDNARDAAVRASRNAVPDAPFKDTWAELGLKQQLLDIAHQHPDTKWIGVAPSSELRQRGEGISPEFQDKQVPNTLEKLLKPFGGHLETTTLFHDPVKLIPKTQVTSTPDMRNYHQWADIRRVPARPGYDPYDEGEVVASTWPRKPIRSLAPRDNPDVLARDLMNNLHPSIGAPQPIKAPIVRLTPEMLEEIRKKGFPLLTALLAAQGMKPEASHEEPK